MTPVHYPATQWRVWLETAERSDFSLQEPQPFYELLFKIERVKLVNNELPPDVTSQRQLLIANLPLASRDSFG